MYFRYLPSDGHLPLAFVGSAYQYMKKIHAKILILAEDVVSYTSARSLLKQQFSTVAICDSPEDLHDILTNQVFDIVLLDLDYLHGGGNHEDDLYWLGYILQTDPHTRVIMLMDPDQAEMTMACLKAGATDFILKPWNMAKLSATVIKALSGRPGKNNIHHSGQGKKNVPPGHITDKGFVPPKDDQKWSDEASQDLLISFHENIINKIPNARELEQMEIEVIRKSLEKNKGNFKAAAADLALPEGDLYFKMEKYNL
jgi:DNA-binding NtrC family response regulator